MRNLILRSARAGLGRRLTGLRDDGGRGAVAVLVAILIGAGVLFGMATLVVDVGQIYQNRAELQNGADAAALAVAKSCAAGNCGSPITTATSYATANASKLTGHDAAVNFVCGAAGATGTVLVGSGTCPGTAPKNVCPANPPSGTNYVDVETSTLMPSGSNLLPNSFAGALAGSSYSGSTVYACAQAEWGSPSVGNTLSLTLGYCAWSQATTGGTSYPTTPIVITFHDASGKDDQSTGCPSNPAGQTAPGNFGWTVDPQHSPPTTPNPNCTLQPSDFTNTGSGYTYGGNTGNNTTSDCLQVLYNAYTSQAVQYIPVYAKYDGTGSNATYTLKGLAAFVVTGYYFGNNSNKNPPELEPSSMSCPAGNGNGKGNGNGNGNGNSVTCISGYFVHQLDPSPGSLANADLGYDLIKLTG